VVPDNVLFEDGRGKELRRMMMEWCDLHTILRLPTGIFYAQGVKTNVIFLRRGTHSADKTEEVWVYNLCAQMPAFGKTNALIADHFTDFVAAYGDDPNGQGVRKDQGEEGRFRCFSREQIVARNDNLDIAWLRQEEEEAEDGLIEPEDIAAAVLGHLTAAMTEIEALSAELNEAEAASGIPEAAE
jgi:type I restriction enzyme M protein